MVAEGFTAVAGFTGEVSMVGDSTAVILAGIATLAEVTTAGMAVAAAITGTEAVGMVALTTVADIGTEARIGGGITHSDPGTMTTVTNGIRATTWTTRRLRFLPGVSFTTTE